MDGGVGNSGDGAGDQEWIARWNTGVNDGVSNDGDGGAGSGMDGGGGNNSDSDAGSGTGST